MKISYKWIKEYVPDLPETEKLYDIFTYHLCEVEGIEKVRDDTIFDLNILPNRAHDLLSHQGIARELASQLGITFKLPEYKIPESKPTKLIKKIETPKCRRYMGRIVRNIKIGSSPEWVVRHLESIGQRSINNIVDATNIITFDCGQPAHVFDLSKVKDLKLQVRNAKKREKITLLGGVEKILNEEMLVISDYYGNALDIAGIKGGKYAELTEDTTDIILECANFDPVSVRKTAQTLNIITDARKRFENNLSPELAEYGMMELSALICEMCPDAIFEDIVDVYPKKQEMRKINFSTDFINKKLGSKITSSEIENIFKNYNFSYKKEKDFFEIIVPLLRLDLEIPEDMVEEIGRIYGYDKVKPEIPKINFKPKINEIFAKIAWAREKLLDDGYSEVMTYSFTNSGEVEVLASASDKKFLRTNLSDGLKESLKLNQLNAPFLGMKEIKIFEIGTIFLKDKEEMHVAYNEKKEIKEITLDKFVSEKLSSAEHENFLLKISSVQRRRASQGSSEETFSSQTFRMWSVYPFISRDVAVWMPEGESSESLKKILKENGTELLIKEPYLFDSFTKEGKTSYAFRLVFQSYDRTLTDNEVNEIMTRINQEISKNTDWQLR